MRIVVSIVRPFVSAYYKSRNMLIFIIFSNTRNLKRGY